MDEDLRSTTVTKEQFDKAFTLVVKKKGIRLKDNVNLYHLQIVDGEFDVHTVSRLLQRTIARYVFSRAEIDGFIKEGDTEAIGNIARKRLKSHGHNKEMGNDLGEMLLYLFLEIEANAPKFMTAPSLVQTSFHYDMRAESIHIRIPENASEGISIILGCSGLEHTLGTAIQKAAILVEELEDNRGNEIIGLRGLLADDILETQYTENQYEALKPYLFPKEAGGIHNNLPISYGIFLGYSFQLSNIDPYAPDFAEKVNKALEQDAEYAKREIEKTFNFHGSERHNMYFYLLPFNDVNKEKTSILDEFEE